MKVLILANGEPPSPELAQRLAAQHDLLLATDGAAHQATRLGLTPDIVCGDFDSVRLDEARATFPQAEFISTPNQEQADLEKALRVARDRGATAITLIGAAGGRIDHTLANVSLLLRYHTEIALCIVDDYAQVWAVSGTSKAPGEHVFPTEPGDTVSLLSLDGRARVTITGVRWPLNDHLLAIGTRGVSNVATADRVEVRVCGGALLVCHLRP